MNVTDNSTGDPAVSVIMPVFGRPDLAAAAIRSYVNQDYPNRQLVVVDDYPVEMRELFTGSVPESELVYIRSEARMTIGAKRNLCCEMADGGIIVHFDADDLSSPDRISSQVRDLVESGLPVTGYRTFPLYDMLTNRAYFCCLAKRLCCGASLAYWREHWERNPFPDKFVGEDEPYTIHLGNRLHTTDGSQRILILLHGDNISTRRQVERFPNVFRPVSADIIPRNFFALHNDLFVGYHAAVN